MGAYNARARARIMAAHANGERFVLLRPRAAESDFSLQRALYSWVIWIYD